MSDYEKSLKAANEQLMTCPFCGGNAKISDSLIHCGKQMYQPLCLDCDAELGYFDTLGEAVAAWNTRAAVPHEMSAREFVATISDMCINQFPAGCAPCPLYVTGHGCGEKILSPENTVAIVAQWAKEHPEKKRKTYAEDFFEKFPNAEPKYYDGRGKEQMIPIPCRQHCYGVVGQKCNGIGCSCSACWNAEMEGEDAEI